MLCVTFWVQFNIFHSVYHVFWAKCWSYLLIFDIDPFQENVLKNESANVMFPSIGIMHIN